MKKVLSTLTCGSSPNGSAKSFPLETIVGEPESGLVSGLCGYDEGVIRERSVKPKTRLVISIAAFLVSAAVLVTAVVVNRVTLYELIPTPPVVVTEKDQGSTVVLTRGQRLAVDLRGNSLSGSTWRANIPLPFLPQMDTVTFQPDQSPATPGDGVQTTLFKAVSVGKGPLFLNYTSDADQNALQPGRTFSIIVTVK